MNLQKMTIGKRLVGSGFYLLGLLPFLLIPFSRAFADHHLITPDAASFPATVSMTITGRPNPTTDQTLVNLIQTQIKVLNRISSTQKFLFGRRMERLHQSTSSAPNTTVSTLNDVNRLTNNRSVFDNGKIETVIYDTWQFMAESKRLELNHSTNEILPTTNPWLPENVTLWSDGVVYFGTEQDDIHDDWIHFSTEGMSIGADTKISHNLYWGAGLGVANGRTTVAEKGTKNDVTGYSFSTYATFQPISQLHVDTTLGVGKVQSKTERYVTPISILATVNRDTNQLFSSLAVDYQFDKPGLILAPHLRYGFSLDTMENGRESGVGSYNLTYDNFSVLTQQVALGFRMQMLRPMNMGRISTQIRMAFEQNFTSGDPAELYYSDLGTDKRYQIAMTDPNASSIQIGVGQEYLFDRNISLGIDYQLIHYRRDYYEQMLGFHLTYTPHSSDGWGSAVLLQPKHVFGIPLTLQVGYTYDSNINHGSSGKQFHDNLYVLQLGHGTTFPLTPHSRLAIHTGLKTKRYQRYNLLSSNILSVKGEWQYRTSGEYRVPTLGIGGRLALEMYESELRDGNWRSTFINARQLLTDRISWFAQISNTIKHANHEVFDLEYNAAQLQLDWSLREKGLIYLSTQFRRGDVVASSSNGSYTTDVPYVKEDALPPHEGSYYYAGQYEADTKIFGLGYNLPIGGQDAIDFSWTYVLSDPESDTPGISNYKTHQISLYYLMKY